MPVIVVKHGQFVKNVIMIQRLPFPPYKLRIGLQNFNVKDTLHVFDDQGKEIPIIQGFAETPLGYALSVEEAITPTQVYHKVIPPRKPANIKEITFVTTWNTACGIATYASFLRSALLRHVPTINVARCLGDVQEPSLIHTQIEFGIFPHVNMLTESRIPKESPKVCTWHTVFRDPSRVSLPTEPLLNYITAVDGVYDAHIVHTAQAKRWLMAYTHKPVYVIPHGSVLWDPIPKNQARVKLRIPMDAQVIFSFGFASQTKGFEELPKVIEELRAKYPRLQLIVSGAVHGTAEKESAEALARVVGNEENGIHVLGRYLEEDEINLYCSAADVLVFNYCGAIEVASASGAIHRVLAAGKPLVMSDDPRTSEYQDGVLCLKYSMGDMESLKACLDIVLSEQDLAEELGRRAQLYAEATSWERVALQHLLIYASITKADLFGPEHYDKEYFVGAQGGLSFVTLQGEVKQWSYYNPDGEWLGAEPIIAAIKKLLNPINMLDAGCGRGTFTAYAKELGIDAAGIDFSKWAIDHPHPKAKGLIQLGDVRDIQLEDKSIDLVFATDICEHIYDEDTDKMITEFQRVSRKWIFYNIGALMANSDEHFVLKKGEVPPLKWQVTAVAGHVNVRPCEYWRQKVTSEHWKLRDDLVEEFRKLVPEDVLAAWKCIIITEYV